MSLSTPLLTLIATCRFSFAALGAESEISPARMLSKVDVKPFGL